MGQIRNTKSREELNIIKSKAKFLKSMTVEISRSANGRCMNSKESLKIEPNKTIKHSLPTVKVQGTNTHFERAEQIKHGSINDNDHE
jgi:hypothetical protein